MARVLLRDRIAALEAENSRLKGQVEALTPKRNAWLDEVAKNPLFKTDQEFNDHQRILRQLRDSDRELEPSTELARLREQYRAIIQKLRKLGGFKSNVASEEYAHREFTR